MLVLSTAAGLVGQFSCGLAIYRLSIKTVLGAAMMVYALALICLPFARSINDLRGCTFLLGGSGDRLSKMVAERQGTPTLPETGEWTKDQFMAHAMASAELQRMSGGSGNGPGNGWGQGGDGRGGENADSRGGRGGRDKKDEEEERPIAIRYGKLPKDAPAMFTELDTDKDGQIGLYEWRTAGNSVLAFMEMDLNGDGLLTVDEYSRYTQQKADREKAVAYQSGETPPKTGNTGRGPGSGPGRGGPTGKDAVPNYFGPTNDKGKDSSSKEDKRGSKGGDAGPGSRGPWDGSSGPPRKKGG
jgi:hypothetical protein